MYPILLIAKTEEVAREFIAVFQKRHGFSAAFLFELSPLKTEITIDQIRELKKQIITTTKEKRLIILYSFDKANIEAQNALLKTLEEKNDSNQFILVVKRVEQVLPTIRSRSQIVQSTSEESAHTVRETTQILLNAIVQEKNFAFLSHASIQSITKEDAEVLLEEILIYLRTMLPEYAQQMPQLLKKVLLLSHQLQHNNLNPQLTVDSALLVIKKTINP